MRPSCDNYGSGSLLEYANIATLIGLNSSRLKAPKGKGFYLYRETCCSTSQTDSSPAAARALLSRKWQLIGMTRTALTQRILF